MNTLTLDQLPNHQACVIAQINPPASAPEWHDWLGEIGFLPGESAMVMTRALPGCDPLVVRVGASTFALRRAEAACIRVTLVQAMPEQIVGFDPVTA